jgi:hypothetical protein
VLLGGHGGEEGACAVGGEGQGRGTIRHGDVVISGGVERLRLGLGLRAILLLLRGLRLLSLGLRLRLLA